MNKEIKRRIDEKLENISKTEQENRRIMLERARALDDNLRELVTNPHYKTEVDELHDCYQKYQIPLRGDGLLVPLVQKGMYRLGLGMSNHPKLSARLMLVLGIDNPRLSLDLTHWANVVEVHDSEATDLDESRYRDFNWDGRRSFRENDLSRLPKDYKEAFIKNWRFLMCIRTSGTTDTTARLKKNGIFGPNSLLPYPSGPDIPPLINPEDDYFRDLFADQEGDLAIDRFAPGQNMDEIFKKGLAEAYLQLESSI